MGETYGSSALGTSVVSVNEPPAKVAKQMLGTVSQRYAAVSAVPADSNTHIPYSEGPEQGEFGDHLISFMQDTEYFVGSCIRCARRYEVDLECLIDASDEDIATLKGYIIGWFLDHDCEHDAMDNALDVLNKFLGKPRDYGTIQQMNREMNNAIIKIAKAHDRVTTYDGP